jgi:hypothetical protein
MRFCALRECASMHMRLEASSFELRVVSGIGILFSV